MKETCKDCKKWEEEMYWTHFRSIHFCQFLFGNFVEELSIPEKFANNLKGKLPETVTLKGPSGGAWNVGLMTSGDALLFKHGWKEFVEDHSLKENDVLIFTFDGSSSFDVLMFDRGSSCEKETSYFVSRCRHTRPDDRCEAVRITRESSEEEVHASPHGNVECTWSGSHNISRANRRGRKKAQVHFIKPVRPKMKLRNRGPSTRAAGASINSDAEQNSRNTYHLQYASNRRPITEEEKGKALQMAQAASTSESFIVVMRPTHVYKRFYMSIPSEWVASHLSARNRNVILRVKENKENTWCARYGLSKVHCGGGLTGGWKDFAFENNLEEYDVCLFELASLADDTIVMDVSIYRVVQEITPLTRVNSASRFQRLSKNAKRKLC